MEGCRLRALSASEFLGAASAGMPAERPEPWKMPDEAPSSAAGEFRDCGGRRGQQQQVAQVQQMAASATQPLRLYTHHVACAAPKGGPVSPALSAKLSTDPSGHYSCCRDREITCLFCAEQVQEVQSWRRRAKQRLIAIHPVALEPATSNTLLKAEVVID